MCSPLTEVMLQDVARGWVGQQRMFTAFDVSLYCKQNRGMQERHNDVKDVIHTMYVSGNMPGYDRTLIPIQGAPVKPFLYHPVGADITQYTPINRNTMPNAQPTTIAQALNRTTTRTAPRRVVRTNDGTVDPDRRKRICVPVSLISGLRKQPGDVVSLVTVSNKVYIMPDQNPNAIASYKVERDGNIRIASSPLSKCNLVGQKYKLKSSDFDGTAVIEIELA